MNAEANTLAGLSFIAFVLLIPVFLWHCHSRNIPAIFLIFWLCYDTLTAFINACIWGREDFDNVWDGKVYCDITLKLEAASSNGKICAISALALNLFLVLRAKNPLLMRNTSTRRIILDLSMCLITPMFIMCVNYVIQASRFVIVRYRGCTMTYAPSPLTLVLFSMWNIIWSFVAVCCAVLTLVTYFRSRKDVRDILRCTNSGLNIRKFARLLIFSLLIIIVLVPISVYYFVSDATVFTEKFQWSKYHNQYWGTILYADLGMSIVYDKWADIALSIVTFFLFGLGTDALEVYKNFYYNVGLSALFGRKKSDVGSVDLSSLSKLETPNTQFTLSHMSTQTRVNTGHSHNSKSKLSSFKNELDNILNEDSSSQGDSKKDSLTEHTCQLSEGLGSPQSYDGFNSSNSYDGRTDLDYMISETADKDNVVSYNFQVRKKS